MGTGTMGMGRTGTRTMGMGWDGYKLRFMFYIYVLFFSSLSVVQRLAGLRP